MLGAILIAALNPLICATLAITCLLVARRLVDSGHFAFLAAAFACCGMAFGANEFLSAHEGPALRLFVNVAFYGAVTLANFAALCRAKIPYARRADAALAAVTLITFCWYLFVTPSTPARIYVINGAFALMTGSTIWKLFQAKPKTHIDWLFIAFAGLLLAVAILRPLIYTLDGIGSDGMDVSDYWTSVLAFTPLICFYTALVFFWAMTKQIVDNVQREADHDYLTGLLNRRGFEKAIGTDYARHHEGQNALLIGDIDNFKSINDKFGHTTGDEVIRFVANAFSELWPEAIIARTGGEEFSIYLRNTTRSNVARQATELAERLSAKPKSLLPENHPLTVSLGAIIATGDLGSSSKHARLADAALYKSKARGKNQIQFSECGTPE